MTYRDLLSQIQNLTEEQLNLAKNGQQLLEILDALASGMDTGESREDFVPTLDEIQF